MNEQITELRLVCLADDFTGATDALETLATSGLRTAMCTGVPEAAEIAGLAAVVVASTARSLPVAEMDAALRPVLTALRGLGARHVFYKVCSTFDSSPETGSIGRVIDLAAGIFAQRTVPVIAGAPALARYCVFGNLFAAAGIAEGAPVHRLDRHPTMSRHPVTPMKESDLRRHLAEQTQRSIGLRDVRGSLPSPLPEVLLCDLFSPEQYAELGSLLDGLAGEGPFFSVGSSGLAACLGAHWQGSLQPEGNWPDIPHTGPVLVASGSCSPVTAAQIACAVAHGFAEVPHAADAAEKCLQHLAAGRSVILHTARGPDDARLSGGIRTGEETGRLLAEAVQTIRASHPLRRILFAGGDSSSHALSHLGIRRLEMLCPITPGAPLCRAGELEIVCKGGQAGPADFFLRAAGLVR